MFESCLGYCEHSNPFRENIGKELFCFRAKMLGFDLMAVIPAKERVKKSKFLALFVKEGRHT